MIDIVPYKHGLFFTGMFNEVCHSLNSGMASDTVTKYNRELL